MPSAKVSIERHIEQILQWFHAHLAASDIRILTGSPREVSKEILMRFEECSENINRSAHRRMKCNIEIRTHLKKDFNCVHDRFAIVDEELWHFGATVGGFHPSVSAASRGWLATEHGAVEFFEEAWSSRRQK
jgi:phage terminase large subunit-like protein